MFIFDQGFSNQILNLKMHCTALSLKFCIHQTFHQNDNVKMTKRHQETTCFGLTILRWRKLITFSCYHKILLLHNSVISTRRFIFWNIHLCWYLSANSPFCRPGDSDAIGLVNTLSSINRANNQFDPLWMRECIVCQKLQCLSSS